MLEKIEDLAEEIEGVVNDISESPQSNDRLGLLQDMYKQVRLQFSQMSDILLDNVTKMYPDSVRNKESKQRYAVIKRIADMCAYIDLNLSYFTQEKPVDLKSTDINYIVGELSFRLRQFLPDKIQLITKFDKNLPNVSADPDVLVHAFGMICKNSIDAMPEGGTLTLQTYKTIPKSKERNPMVVVKMMDTGSGLDTFGREHLFEPFNSSPKNSMGKGLGLAAAFGIVKSHNGVIDVQPGKDGGTGVTLKFPIVAEKNESSNAPDDKKRKFKGTVLVIDDNIEVAEGTAKMASRAGYHALTATTCADGERQVEKHKSTMDVVIIDNNLDECSGRECAQILLKINPDIKLIFYSGADDDFELFRYINRIGAGWLKKPFESKELAAAIEKVLQGKGSKG